MADGEKTVGFVGSLEFIVFLGPFQRSPRLTLVLSYPQAVLVPA